MPLRIRPATPDDIPEILSLIRELAEYEREPQSAVATPEDLMRDGFTEPKRFHCLMAEVEEGVAGFALFFYNYSTWRGHSGIYLEDLFVRPRFRGTGIGKALLSSVAAVAVEDGCPRLEWAVLDWNKPAIDFYESVGAVGLTEWTIMRVSGDALPALAKDAPGREQTKAPAGA
ncbi:MAG TPA: GNAT family N-acetyltransferase [Acidobacteriaceae bacterium]|jgi:GNAT superfamily N-acetyltransferase|nr:GNAT family N-acetyltransferase [Acidobacteriaceae bacterium]